MTELEELIAQRNALDDKIKFLKGETVQCGDVKFYKKTCESGKEEWFVSALVKSYRWWKGNFTPYDRWTVVCRGDNRDDVLEYIDALIVNLSELRKKVKK